MDAKRSQTLSPAQAREQVREGVPLLDLRGAGERLTGMPEGAVAVLPESLSGWLARHPEKSRVLLICARGIRSAHSVEQHQGQPQQLLSVEGGFEAWQDAGLPVAGQPFDRASQTQRYQKHLLLDEVGVAGQQKLLDARVLIVGAGGLGSPAALYLAAAGIGTLGLVDDDRVERSNLQRQILHSDPNVGELKVVSGARSLEALNPDITIQTFNQRLTTENANRLISDWDIVVDAVDNFPARYALMDAAAAEKVPAVYGAVDQFNGQVGLFTPWQGKNQACYRCLFPNAPESALNCSEAGVLGAVPGVIGTLQAVEAIKLICGIGEPLRSQLVIYDALRATTRKVKVVRDPACNGVGHSG